MNKRLVRRLAALLLSSSVVISSMGVSANTNVLVDGNITREEFAKMCEQNLTELGYNFEQLQTSPFKDTKNESVIKLHNAGLLTGTAVDQFSPKAAITVEQMAAILVRMYDKLEVELPKVRDLETLDQESISPWALDAVKLAYEAGLIGGDGVALSPKSQIRQEQMDLVVAQSELVIADIKSKQVQDTEYYTYSPVSKTITIKKDLDLNELGMAKDFQKMIINAGVKITLTDLKIEEVAVNEGASVTLENMQVNKLELLGNDLDKEQAEDKGTLITNIYLEQGSKVKNVILETKTNLYAAADSQIEEIAIKTEAKDSELEIKNAKGMNIKADSDLKLNGKDLDKNNVSQHLKDIVNQQIKTESDKTTSTGGSGDGGNTGGDNNTDDGNNGDNNTGDDSENTTPDEEGTVQTVYDKLTDKFILGEKNSSLGNVQHDLNLPWDLDGCDIYWEFSRPDIIKYDGTLLGTFGRVELTATIKQGDERMEKKFNLNVRKFVDLEDMRQALDNWDFIEEISGDYELDEYIGGYRVVYMTKSTCVGVLDGKTYILKPTGNGIAELRVIMADSGAEITRNIEIRVNLNGPTPPDTTTDTAISLVL